MKIKYLLAAVVLGLVFLYSACAVNAQSLSVADQIKALQEQIAKLQEQLLALLAEQKKWVTWCHTFNVDLRPGDGGSGTATETEVQNLQIALEKEGFAVADA